MAKKNKSSKTPPRTSSNGRGQRAPQPLTAKPANHQRTYTILDCRLEKPVCLVFPAADQIFGREPGEEFLDGRELRVRAVARARRW